MKATNPKDVAEGRSRNLAWIVYLLLVCGFLALSAWSIAVAAIARKDPPTRTRIESKLAYIQPQYLLCPGFGWDVTYDRNSPACDFVYKGDSPNVVLPSCSVSFEQPYPGETTECLVFNNITSYKFATSEYQMQFYFSFNYTVPETVNGEINVAFLEWEMLLRDPTSISVDESPASLQFGFNSVKVYASKKTYLDKSVQWSYDASTTFVKTKGFSASSIWEYPEFMFVTVSIPNTHVTVIEEVDPLNIATILGAIGGFWNYVGLAFGALFVVQAQPVQAKFIAWKDGDKKEEATKPQSSEMSNVATASSS